VLESLSTVKADAHLREVEAIWNDSMCIRFTALVTKIDTGKVEVRRGGELPDEPLTYDEGKH
jgi:hypothetical protein